MVRPRGRQSNDPTPRQIEAACEQIRKSWSEEERARRIPATAWRVPMYHTEAAADGSPVFVPCDETTVQE